MSKHTPGPWRPCANLVLGPSRANGDAMVVATCNDVRDEGNSRLIAAAPELLAALRDAHIALIEYRAYGESMREIGRGFDASGHDGATITTVLARIGAAIRKATGEEG